MADVQMCACGCGLPSKSNAQTGRVYRYRRGHNSKGERHPQWRGGVHHYSTGYVGLKCPDHPRAGRHGYVMEHILVVERAMGKYLRLGAPVHHVDEDKTNNAPTNLVACDSEQYHRLLHQRKRAYDACGDPNAQRCSVCGTYGDQPSFVGGRHRECNARQARERYRRLHPGSKHQV
jgi:HNH endonuclease